jgi:hypothetical protein
MVRIELQNPRVCPCCLSVSVVSTSLLFWTGLALTWIESCCYKYHHGLLILPCMYRFFQLAIHEDAATSMEAL